MKAQLLCSLMFHLAGPYDPYYVKSFVPDPYPVDPTTWLKSIQTQIGVDNGVTWGALSKLVYNKFFSKGDWMRTSLPLLESIINGSSTTGVRVILWNGDADFLLNYMGYESMIRGMMTRSA